MQVRKTLENISFKTLSIVFLISLFFNFYFFVNYHDLIVKMKILKICCDFWINGSYQVCDQNNNCKVEKKDTELKVELKKQILKQATMYKSQKKDE